MGWLDAFRRRGTGGPVAVRARLEGAMSQRRLRGWQPPLENINSLIASGGPRLLARSRELVVTNGYAANACEAFASNLVGDGIKPSSLIEDPALRDKVQRLWLAWTDEADADGLTDFYGLQAMVAREMFVAGERAVTAAMREAGTSLKSAWRTQITGAGLGTRLANSIRSASFPKSGESLNAAALVWSNAPVIIGPHDTGPLIRSKSGFWLAIPTPAAGKSTRGGRITPGEWERRTGMRLRFIYRRRGPSLLVAEGRLNTKGRAVASKSKTGRGLVTAPIFLLVPQVKLPKRLDLARDAARAHDAVPGLIVANWVDVRSGL
jgi:hypothetical protein